MTDKDIIKALECCGYDEDMCLDCPIAKECESNELILEKKEEILELIKNQQAKITELEAECVKVNFAYIGTKALYGKTAEELKTAKTEAYKEFVVKLLALIGSVELSNLDLRRHINNLLKELIEKGGVE